VVKDDTKWDRDNPPHIKRKSPEIIVIEKSGVREPARKVKTILDP